MAKRTYASDEYLNRSKEVEGHLRALWALSHDFKTLGQNRSAERRAIGTLIRDLSKEQRDLDRALLEGRVTTEVAA